MTLIITCWENRKKKPKGSFGSACAKDAERGLHFKRQAGHASISNAL